MDQLLIELTKYGMVGVLSAVIVFFAWVLLDRTLKGRERDFIARDEERKSDMDRRESDLVWYRQQLDLKRAEFLTALKDQATASKEALITVASQFQNGIESICERLEHMEKEIKLLWEQNNSRQA